MVRWARQYYVDFIPEVPSLTHSNYLLTRHRELAEVADAEWPDTYCPSHPGSYKLLFDVLDEVIEVVKPQMMHIGHVNGEPRPVPASAAGTKIARNCSHRT